MEQKSDVYSKIQHLLADEPSDWLADNKKIEDGAAWLKHSQTVALRVLRRLREMGLSQNELADKIGVSRQQVNKWLKGRENFTFETVSRLGEAVGMSLLELVQPFSKVNETSTFRGMLNGPYEVFNSIEKSDYTPIGGIGKERDIISLVPLNVTYYK